VHWQICLISNYSLLGPRQRDRRPEPKVGVALQAVALRPISADRLLVTVALPLVLCTMNTENAAVDHDFPT
jgi:hypothetical protein